ncbi:MAG TPA: heavy-metal-associated domain-containing protein [Terriglobia bacterium]|nr:heavy-metal-associated domain-containing protein [Terriglobia bacterium]
MKLQKQIVLLCALVLTTALPAMAQVEKAAMRTTGISCGVCAAVTEFYLKRLPSIDKINISLKNEAVMVSYKPGTTFQPKDLREALQKSDVAVTQLQITARGRVQEQAGKRFFIAGKDKFALVSAANTPPPPSDTPVSIEAVVNDRTDPIELRIMTYKPVNP